MSAGINRSLTTIKTELEFLQESNVITRELYDQITSSLPRKYESGMAPFDIVVAKVSAPAPSINNQNELAEALYDYQAQQPEDLSLKRGDKVTVIEKTSESWWKGSCNGITGMFPSNYVRVLGGSAAPSLSEKQPETQAAPAYFQQQQQQPISGFQQQQQLPMGMPPQGYQQQQMPYPPQGYQQQQMPFPPQQFQAQPPPEQPQQQHDSSGAFKRFGSKLGNAAIFGAGATIGSDIVNSIF